MDLQLLGYRILKAEKYSAGLAMQIEIVLGFFTTWAVIGKTAEAGAMSSNGMEFRPASQLQPQGLVDFRNVGHAEVKSRLAVHKAGLAIKADHFNFRPTVPALHVPAYDRGLIAENPEVIVTH
jgi:hypothetical protein